MQQFTLKSGTNKGNRRIWIEGSRLIEAGLTCGTILYRSDDSRGDMVLSTYEVESTATVTARGKHKVAGKPDRPIIDLCGKWVTAFVGDHTHFSVTVIQYDGYQSDGDIDPLRIALLIRPTNA